MASMRHRHLGRFHLRWVVLLLGLFVYLLALTRMRVEYNEQTTRIERLERTLKERRSDEAYLAVSIKRACTYGIVQDVASQEWEMDVASLDQRVRIDVLPLATADESVADAQEAGIWKRVSGYLPDGVKEAKASTGWRRDRVSAD